MKVKSSQITSTPTGKDRCTTSVQPPLTSTQFATLLAALNKHLTWNKPDTRPRVLSLNQFLKITLLYLRQNSTVKTSPTDLKSLNPQFPGSSTASENALTQLPELSVPALETLKNVPGSLVVDGTLIPVKELGFTSENTIFRQTQTHWL